MPIGSAHRKQSAKNWLLLALLLVLVGSVYAITILRLSHPNTATENVTHR